MTAMTRSNRGDADDAITPERPITARMTAGEWGKVLSIIVTCVVGGAMYVQSLQSAVNDAAREARAAASDARAALAQAAEIKSDLTRALGEISGKLGYIQGQLEQITRERSK